MTGRFTLAGAILIAVVLLASLVVTRRLPPSTPLATSEPAPVASATAPGATPGTPAPLATPTDPGQSAVPAGKATRGFLMGFTSWPYAATVEAVKGTYAFIGTNADFITEHLDDGVPWAETLQDAPFPKAVQDKLEGRRQNRPAGTKLLLALTPLNLGRSGLAECAGDGPRPLPAELKDASFRNPHLARAYANYCRRMVEFFLPDFLITGIEANELLNNRPEEWEGYVRMSQQVQHELRERFPHLPLAESVTLHKLLDRQTRGLADYQATIRDFVASHDFFAVSFYPLFLGLHTEREFADALDFLPTFSRKPIVIAETGHPAEPVRVRTFKLDFPTDPGEQETFVRVLLSRAQAHHYSLVTYWTARDFDALWETFPAAVKDLGALWRDTGLVDEAGRSRPAHETWRRWLAVPRT